MKKVALEKWSKKSECSWGFPPLRSGSPQIRYLLNRYYVIIALSEGRNGGPAHVPSVILPVLFISIIGKGILQSQKI
jgi:hypothetical protein